MNAKQHGWLSLEKVDLQYFFRVKENWMYAQWTDEHSKSTLYYTNLHNKTLYT